MGGVSVVPGLVWLVDSSVPLVGPGWLQFFDARPTLIESVFF